MQLSMEQFDELFDSFHAVAFRLEVRAAYNIPVEQPSIQLFREGKLPEHREHYPWRDLVAEATTAGKRFERVHVITPPISEYIRYQAIWGYKNSAPAGEDIRILDTSQYPRLDLPNEDFWLFDNSTAVRLNYSDDDSFIGLDLVEGHNA